MVLYITKRWKKPFLWQKRFFCFLFLWILVKKQKKLFNQTTWRKRLHINVCNVFVTFEIN